MDTISGQFTQMNETLVDTTLNNCTNASSIINSTLCDSVPDPPPPSADLTGYIFLSLELIVGTIILVSNSLVILILYNKDIVRGTTSTFMISLAACDLYNAFSIFHCILVDFSVYTGHLGSLIACELCTVTANSAAGISTFCLLSICVERLMAVAYPYAHAQYLTQRLARNLVAIIWCIWIGVTAFFTFYFIHGAWYEGTYCWSSFLFPTYVFYILTGPVIVAITLSIAIYSMIFRIAAKKAKQIGIQEDVAGIAKRKRENKVTQMMALMFGAFIVCYSPLTLMMLIMGANITAVPFVASRLSWLLFIANSFMNPIIFFWKSPRFRHALKQLLHVVPHNSVAPDG